MVALRNRKLAPGLVTIEGQTDRRKGGRQFSEANLLMNIAQEQGWFLLWHKIELVAEVGKSNLYRPTFRNMLCFGRGKMSAGQAALRDGVRLLSREGRSGVLQEIL